MEILIERTVTRKVQDRTYSTVRLVERVATRGRQRVLTNLGTDFAVPKRDWRMLSKLIREELSESGQKRLFDDERTKRLSEEAFYIVKRVKMRG